MTGGSRRALSQHGHRRTKAPVPVCGAGAKPPPRRRALACEGRGNEPRWGCHERTPRRDPEECGAWQHRRKHMFVEEHESAERRRSRDFHERSRSCSRTPTWQAEGQARRHRSSTLVSEDEAPGSRRTSPGRHPRGFGPVSLALGVEDFDATCERLREQGVELLNGPIDRPWGIRTASFRDPGGHIWEIAH